MSSGNWSFIFVPPGLALTFWLLRKFLPAPAKAEKAEAEKPEVSLNKEQAQKYTGWCGVLWLIAWPVTWLFLTWLFSGIATLWYAKRFPEATFALTPGWLLYLLPAAFPSMATAAYIADRALRLIMGARNYQELDSYTTQFSGINWQPLIRPVIIFVILSAIIPFLVMINWYVLFTPEHIVIKPAFSKSRITQQYSDIENIRTASAWVDRRKGHERIVPDRQYIIQFRNGEKWITKDGYNFPETYNSPARLTPEQKAQILAFVSQKSGVPITEMKVLNPYEP